MPDIPLPEESKSIYDYGFDKSLNRDIVPQQSPTVYNVNDQTAAQNLSFGSLTTGDHSNTFGSDPKDGIWLGAEKFSDAPFRVTQQGVMYASAANIAGTINASVGTIGGWTVGANVISAGSGSAVVGLDSTVSGADDIRIYAGSTPPNSAPFKVTEAGAVTASNITITGGSVAASTLSGAVPQANLNVANRNWVQTCAFTVTDADTIAWGTGTFTSADGTAYSISAGNTGNMAAKTYVYLDTNVSTTVYQTTTTAATASGAGKVLIAVCQNATGEAKFMLFNDNSYNIDAANIVANSITANELSTSITYAGEIIISPNGDIRSGQTGYNTGTGWFIGNPSGTAKMSIGDGGVTDYMLWNGENLNLSGTNVSSVVARSNAFFTKNFFLGSYLDGITANPGTGIITRKLVNTLIDSGSTDGAGVQLGSDSVGYKPGSSTLSDWDNDYDFTVRAAFVGITGNANAGVGIGDPVTAGAATVNTNRGFRFYLIGTTLYASNGDNTNETRTDVSSGITVTSFNTYRIVYTHAVNVKFYINDVLVATHTTNLPSGNTVFTGMTFSTRQVTPHITAFQLYIANNYSIQLIA